jgi:hypothetical protein
MMKDEELDEVFNWWVGLCGRSQTRPTPFKELISMKIIRA